MLVAFSHHIRSLCLLYPCNLVATLNQRHWVLPISHFREPCVGKVALRTHILHENIMYYRVEDTLAYSIALANLKQIGTKTDLDNPELANWRTCQIIKVLLLYPWVTKSQQKCKCLNPLSIEGLSITIKTDINWLFLHIINFVLKPFLCLQPWIVRICVYHILVYKPVSRIAIMSGLSYLALWVWIFMKEASQLWGIP